MQMHNINLSAALQQGGVGLKEMEQVALGSPMMHKLSEAKVALPLDIDVMPIWMHLGY